MVVMCRESGVHARTERCPSWLSRKTFSRSGQKNAKKKTTPPPRLSECDLRNVSLRVSVCLSNQVQDD